MIDPAPSQRWQFSLRRLFFAVTTSAVGCGVAASDLPFELKYAGLCVPVFWSGVAAMFYGAVATEARATAVQVAGEYLIALGFGVAFCMALVGSFAMLILLSGLIVYVVG